jgi:hypothetical protein
MVCRHEEKLVGDEELLTIVGCNRVWRVEEGVGDGAEVGCCHGIQIQTKLLNSRAAFTEMVRDEEGGAWLMILETDCPEFIVETDELEAFEALVSRLLVIVCVDASIGIDLIHLRKVALAVSQQHDHVHQTQGHESPYQHCVKVVPAWVTS